MGTWGSGLLENDSAQDFLDEIVALDQHSRYERISQALNTVVDNPATVMQRITPEEVIAAVVIVAASVLTEAEHDLVEPVNEVRDGRLMRKEAYSLVGVALLALRSIISGERGWWMESWVTESDRQRASRQIQEIIAILDRQATLESASRTSRRPAQELMCAARYRRVEGLDESVVTGWAWVSSSAHSSDLSPRLRGFPCFSTVPLPLPLSRRTLNYVAGIIRRHLKVTGSRWRKLDLGHQALLVLASLIDRRKANALN